MKNKVTNNLNFVAAILLGIVAMLSFFQHKTSMGITYICSAICFCTLEFSKKKNANHK
ncbi:hypothetical protein [Clostridium botulinum]|uniref:Uncharacterized protein n=1 Tax=Clostridium botulinum (strain Langeland / NCTC 10281 / Type F) TaxID=441772 RepID=A7GF94_CLOBL|nr:hypothetical protein [Clostridium botulinum]ABS41107.1 hypothetical protein CLI_2203 [Clostridium botulinum F str. Langeland]ADF99856.1 hypothetical protein CBF_2187 [Clostridium botulinum F str. 230613]MBY6792944.1 hypothetical protein [Clostridium botulinum]MBY6937153.1 hypothetical protein [Clostridium botulinum]MBY6944573.1 hypothetical protein [Clostridium botulinum]